MAITADFETGVNGNTISTGDPGSATAFEVVSIGASSVAAYDNTHAAFGSLSGHLTSAGNNVLIGWTTSFGNNLDHYGRMYLWLNGFPTGYINLINVYETVGAVRAIVRLQSDGTFIFIDSPINVSGASSVPCATGQWIRVEWHIVHNPTTGLIETKLFNTAASTTPSETFTWSNRDTGSAVDRLFFGTIFDSGNTHNIWLDNIIGAATQYPGPVAADVLQVLSMQPHISGHSRW